MSGLTELLIIFVIFIISLSGILLGLILARIAPEELVPGKKYYLLAKRISLGLISVFIIYTLGSEKRWFFLIFFIISIILVLVIQIESFWKSSNYLEKWLQKILPEMVTYLLFIAAYITFSKLDSQLILASLIFIYGLPTGTLLRIK